MTRKLERQVESMLGRPAELHGQGHGNDGHTAGGTRGAKDETGANGDGEAARAERKADEFVNRLFDVLERDY